jgi:hypothetical protein
VAFFYKDGKEYVTSNEFKTVFFNGQIGRQWNSNEY